MPRLRTRSLKLARGKMKFFISGFCVFLGLFIILLASYASSYSDKILLNSYLLGENISGKNKEQIIERLDNLEAENKGRTIILSYEGDKFEKKFEDLNWSIKKDQTIDNIFAYGHSDNMIKRLVDCSKSIFVKTRFEVVFDLDHRILDDWIDYIEDSIASPKKEANIIVRNGRAEIISPEAGTVINRNYLADQVRERFLLIKNDEIPLELVEDTPLISKEQADALKEEAIAKTTRSITLIGPKGNVVLYPNTLGKLLILKINNEGTVFISLDDNKVRSILEANSHNLNIEPKDALFTISEGNIVLETPSKSGQIIKVAESVQAVIEHFEQGEVEVKLPYEQQEPAISAQNIADIQKYGIREIIGRASTDFSGSPVNRIHNIKNGVKYISGVIIKPGEEFSTVKKLGSIDANSGYLPELVIKKDETVPEFGGGLCQVSTTLFRAAMDAGLKISERQNHSYRVSYYEPPVGMDATIYSPKPDFKFINTTDNAILVYGYVTGYEVTFEIYGTNDGRTVEITEPEVFDITSPPEPIYIEDPSLEPGEEKRIDRAHSGAKSVFYYRVRKNGKLIEDNKFFSYYVAWPAKYLRGPQPPQQQEEEKQSDAGGR